ncbi:hypothetical protein [Nitrospira sp. Kam-Ns4a]
MKGTGEQGTKRKPAGAGKLTPRRAAKEAVLARLRRDSEQLNGAKLLSLLKRQGYEELPLDEIQDRLSKLRTSLGESLLGRRQ